MMASADKPKSGASKAQVVRVGAAKERAIPDKKAKELKHGKRSI